MTETKYRNRRAAELETSGLRLTMLVEGGHVAQILHKQSGVNPLWTPPWPSIDPSDYQEARHPEYGANIESRLLAGIMGHSLCMDIFGAPSTEEAAAGLDVHGEVSAAPYGVQPDGDGLVARTVLPEAGLKFERWIRIAPNDVVIHFTETVENLRETDRPIGWTQHVTLGPPFLERGLTQFRAPGARSKVYETDFAGDKSLQVTGAEFDWPRAPLKDGGTQDLRVLTDAAASGAFTTTLMDPGRERAFFAAFSPSSKVLFGYAWRQSDFPWLGIWEENRSRAHPPWNGETLALGMEFGASPMAETRRQMVERGSLFGASGYRWIPARTKVTVNYCAFITQTDVIPESVSWDGGDEVRL